MTCSIGIRTTLGVLFVILIILVIVPVAAQTDTDIHPDYWQNHTWHYPVVKRPLSPEEIQVVAKRQREEPPVIRLAGGEYEMAVMGVHGGAVRRLQEMV